MGFDEGRIVLNSDTGTYFPGQTLCGKLEFHLDKDKKFRGIYAEIVGNCKVHWTKRHSRKVNNRRVHYTVTHESYEEYMNTTMYLIGSKNGEQTLHPGRHVFPFECQIPPHCPSSFQADNGRVQYKVKVTVDRAFKTDQTKEITFRIFAPLDLNTLPDAKTPIEMEFEQTFCCWCMNAGLSETLVKLPASGFCPKQVIPIELACNNNSNVDIDTIKFSLQKIITFEAERAPDTRTEDTIIASLKKGPVPGNTTRNWTVEVEVPDFEVHNLNTCRFITIDYRFKVDIATSGCHVDEDDSRRIFIGTIPLASLQYPSNSNFETSNITPGVTSYRVGPIVNQPLPNIAPYPDANPPYPGSNSPYPGNTPNIGFVAPENPPYPTVSPHPAPSPYPVGTNPPYPVGNGPSNPPYPAGNGDRNPLYPASNSPYHGGNGSSPYVNAQHVNSPPYPNSSRTSPYPAQSTRNPPYPNTSNPPYVNAQHVNSPPYPNSGRANPPYPTNSNPPYPTFPNVGANLDPADSNHPKSNSPYSSNVPGLKTGTLGFTSNGPKETMPLLPPGAAPLPASPYASASAPPSTPDDENKKLAESIPPPYPQLEKTNRTTRNSKA